MSWPVPGDAASFAQTRDSCPVERAKPPTSSDRVKAERISPRTGVLRGSCHTWQLLFEPALQPMSQNEKLHQGDRLLPHLLKMTPKRAQKEGFSGFARPGGRLTARTLVQIKTVPGVVFRIGQTRDSCPVEREKPPSSPPKSETDSEMAVNLPAQKLREALATSERGRPTYRGFPRRQAPSHPAQLAPF